MISKLQIETATKFAWSLVGIPYKLGGNVPQDGGMDCSAVCLELLRCLGLWNTTDARAQDILNSFEKKNVQGVLYVHEGIVKFGLDEGDFMFFGKGFDKITHIAYSLGNGHMIEAGGDDKTGMVRVRPVTWRKDFLAIIKTSRY